MRAVRPLAALAIVAVFGMARGADDPLRLVPWQADFVLRIDSPHKLVDAVTATEPVRELSQFAAVREALQTTNARRAARLLSYYEKELAAKWPDLLDRLAGGGIVLAGRFDRTNQAPALFVIQGTDSDLWKRALAALLQVIEQEEIRQDAKDRPIKDSYRGLETIHIGNDVHLARAGSALLVSNKIEAVHAGLDLYINGRHDSLTEVAGPNDANKLLPPEPLVSLWVNLKPAQESPEGKEFFKRPKQDPAQLIFAGGLLDVIGHAPFLAMGTYRQPDGAWMTTVRMPRGRDATPEGQALHVAPAGQPGCLPPLAPADALYSTSFYLDLGKFWTDRDKLLGENARKAFDQAEKNLGRFLAGRKLSELLTQAGPYHRFVAAAQAKSGYAKHPNQIIPAFAYNVSMRDPGFGKAMDGLLRAVALFAGLQAKLKLVEETVDGVMLVGYRFPEDGTLPADVNNIRFNFSPCFAAVGDQFFAASTMELGREMIRTLKRPATNTPSSDTAVLSRLSAAGGAALLKAFEDQVLTQAALDRAMTIDEVRSEVTKFVAWVGKLGELDFDTEYRTHEFRFEIQWINRRGTESTEKSKANK
ncbi:MAG TPA: hypothetical protein VH120_20370 [Gemmataceae bacterium]|nr:hypothetical protein [Gemmataceae bacterium]